ncbi:MAG: hypothetical protein ACKO5E_05125, partial [bacterium]
SESLLVHDLANVRHQIQDADARRSALFESLRLHAEKLFDKRQDDLFYEHLGLWKNSPDSHCFTILKTVAGVRILMGLWAILKGYKTGGTTSLPPSLLYCLLPQFGGSLNPFEAIADGQELVNLFVASAPDINEFLSDWSNVATPDLTIAMKKWCETCETRKTDAAPVMDRIGQIATRETIRLTERLNLLYQAEQNARKQFTHSYQASPEHNESLRHINADRKILQQRHDQTLRMLTQIQERRLRESARKAEKDAAKQAMLNAQNAALSDKIQESEKRPAIISFEQKASQSAKFRYDQLMPRGADPAKSPRLAKIIREATEPLLTDDDLVELEMNLADGEFESLPLIHAAQLLSHWEDHHFESLDIRFNNTFDTLSDINNLNAIRELFAEERLRRHDINKLLEVA